jgi:hypothetical protein
MTDQETNYGYAFTYNDYGNNTSQPYDYALIDEISDDYAYKNATLIVRPYEPEDIYIDQDLNYSTTTYITNTPLPPSWAFQGWQGLLTFNVDYTKIKDEDVLRVSIPKIRLTEHLGTIFTPTTITLVRSNAILETNRLGNLIEPLKSESFHVIKRQNVLRRHARNQTWVDMNATWDDDWNMHESIHYLTFASHHTFAGSVKVSGDVGLSYDKTTNKVVPNMDIKFKVSDDTNIGNNVRVRHNNEVSRRAVLTQIVGDIGHGTYNDNGTNYAIRTAGQLQFYFKPYLTKIVE